jgi:hypothetical protein
MGVTGKCKEESPTDGRDQLYFWGKSLRQLCKMNSGVREGKTAKDKGRGKGVGGDPKSLPWNGQNLITGWLGEGGRDPKERKPWASHFEAPQVVTCFLSVGYITQKLMSERDKVPGSSSVDPTLWKSSKQTWMLWGRIG